MSSAWQNIPLILGRFAIVLYIFYWTSPSLSFSKKGSCKTSIALMTVLSLWPMMWHIRYFLDLKAVKQVNSVQLKPWILVEKATSDEFTGLVMWWLRHYNLPETAARSASFILCALNHQIPAVTHDCSRWCDLWLVMMSLESGSQRQCSAAAVRMPSCLLFSCKNILHV